MGDRGRNKSTPTKVNLVASTVVEKEDASFGIPNGIPDTLNNGAIAGDDSPSEMTHKEAWTHMQERCSELSEALGRIPVNLSELFPFPDVLDLIVDELIIANRECPLGLTDIRHPNVHDGTSLASYKSWNALAAAKILKRNGKTIKRTLVLTKKAVFVLRDWEKLRNEAVAREKNLLLRPVVLASGYAEDEMAAIRIMIRHEIGHLREDASGVDQCRGLPAISDYAAVELSERFAEAYGLAKVMPEKAEELMPGILAKIEKIEADIGR